jgi:hypothetical protein
MELMKGAQRHTTRVSEIIHIFLNILFAFAVLGLVKLFGTATTLPVLAYLLVFLSKWRVFAVRPRYWWDNFQTNLLDVLVGVSFVTFIWQSEGNIGFQILLTILYILWLIFLKPRSSRFAITIQAGIGQFLALTTLFATAYAWPAIWVVVATWVIGYISARHVLSAYNEEDITLLSLVWAFILAEAGWVLHHWTIAYNIPLVGTQLKIPQIAIFLGLLSHVSIIGYASYAKHGTVKLSAVIWPYIFSIIVILVMMLFLANTYTTV